MAYKSRMTGALWLDPFYLENFAIIAGFLAIIGAPLYLFKDKKTQVQASWASVKSWLYTLPLLFFFIGLPMPGPFIFLALVSIYSSKTFFQMVGIYHRNWFVLLTYGSISVCALALYMKNEILFIISPVLFMLFTSLIPVARNNSKNMVQYFSLTVVCFFLLGWNMILGGKLFDLQNGIYTLLYLYVLSEFSGNLSSALSLSIPAPLVISRVSTRTRWSGFILSLLATILVAWAFRRLLFSRDELYWISAALIAFLGSHLGEWTLSVFRKDLGVKDQGVFIIGRGDLLSRSSKVMYVYPLFTSLLLLTGDLSFSF